MKTAFITGANKGIGFEIAKQLLQKGFYVYIGSRDKSRGQEAVGKLNAEGLVNAKAVQIDVTDEESVLHASTEIGKEITTLDILINNAGISGVKIDKEGSFVAETLTAERASIGTFKEVYETNVYGVVRVTQAFLALLKKSSEPRIVMVSSSVGSLTQQSNPEWPMYDSAKFAVYASSKSAMNMYTIHLAYEFRNTPFRINMVDPGYTKTDFNYNMGFTDVETAAERITKYTLIGPEGPTGKFFSEENNPITGEIPW